jgi:predicted RecA/RadA family phage recombinase
MATNYKGPGSKLDMAAPTGGVVSGNAYLIGYAFGVAERTADAGAIFPLQCVGIYELPKVSGTAATQGARAYWDDTNKVVTPTASTHRQIGIFTADATSGATVANVRIGVLVS